MHPSAGTGKRPPLTPQEGWLSNGRQVLHFRPSRYDHWSQALELTSGVLIPSQPPVVNPPARRPAASMETTGQATCF